MGRGVFNIVIGLAMIVGGLSGKLVLRGTGSGMALAGIGLALVGLGVARMVLGRRQERRRADRLRRERAREDEVLRPSQEPPG